MATEFFGKIKGSIDKSVATVSIKSNEFVEITKFKTQISSLEKEIEALQLTLGKGYYRLWASSANDFAELEDICAEINRKEAEIQNCKNEMEELQNNNKKILGNEGENKCPVCGATNKAEAKFCVGCGNKLIEEDMMLCSCGAKIKKTAKFCPSCGNPVVNTTVVEEKEEFVVASEVEPVVTEAEAVETMEVEVVEAPVEEMVETPAQEVIVCQCGAEYPVGTKFCGKCGCSLA